jgi:NAD(P)-dependent dehydrogenase (short-subunit alcohol dehydrogenase family)
MRLKGRVAIVTGSSAGIGQEIARLFAAEGAKVAINSRSQDRARAVSEDLRAQGFESIAVQADVAVKAEADSLVAETVRQLGKLDILVNNAGISMIAPSEELAEDDWRRTLDIDLSGAFFCCQAAAQAMKASGGGAIVNVSSILGDTAFPKRAAYCAAKHGLNGLTKVLGIEWARYGIRVNTVSPAYIATPMDIQDQGTGDYTSADIKRRTPLGRYGTPDEVARAALFLACEDSSFMTGSILTLDGGWTAYGAW